MELIKGGVIVCGGGTAGLPAAVAAARQGASVCVVEEDERIGGAAVDQYIQAFCGHPVQGIYRELVEKMREYTPERRLPNAFRHSSYIMAYNELMEGLPIRVVTRQHIGTVRTVGGRITAVESDDYRFEGEVFLDCTGDGDVAALAGCPFRMGREAASEFDEAFAPEEADGWVQQCTLMYTVKRRPDNKTGNDANRICMFDADEYLIWGPTVTCADPTDERQLAAAQEQAMAQLPAEAEKWRKEGFTITGVAPKLGVRESRRIEGLYQLSYNDIVGEHTFPDSVCVVNYNIDPWEPEGNPQRDKEKKKRTFMPDYEIPYRCLVNRKIDNLIVAGRCVSATHIANSSLRVMGIAIPLGQAAGTAAALALRDGCAARDIDTGALRAILREGGVTVSLTERRLEGGTRI